MTAASTSPLERRIATILLGSSGLILLLFGMAALTAAPPLLALLGIDPANPPTPTWRTTLTRMGGESLVRSGLLLAALAWLHLPALQQRLAALAARRGMLAGGGIVALLALYLPALMGNTAVLNTTRYWWLIDDAMVSMRYAHNFARGLGLVWNRGEYVEGYTNFLWTLVMALVHLLPIPISHTSLVVALINMALAAAAIPVLLALLRFFDADQHTIVLALLSYVLNLNIKNWAIAGIETPILTLFVLLAVWRVLEESRTQRPTLLPFLLIGTMTLVRADALVLAALLCGTALVLQRQRVRVVLLSLVAMLVPAAHFAFRWSYYGDLIPNTAYLKVANWDTRYLHGIGYVADFASDYIIVILFVLAGLLLARTWPLRLLPALVLGYTIYIGYAGGDIFEHYRFFLPVVPLLLLLAYLAIQRLVVAHPTLRLLLGMLCLITTPLLVPGTTTTFYPRYSSLGNLKIGLLLRDNRVPGTRVADFWAGMTFYFSDAPGIDLLGKNNTHIAHLPALYGNLPGHNKFDFDYSLATLRPDYVVSSFHHEIDKEEIRAISEHIPWRGRLYFNETFREHCMPYPVTVDTWRTIYVCDWADPRALQQRDQWRVPFDLTERAPTFVEPGGAN